MLVLFTGNFINILTHLQPDLMKIHSLVQDITGNSYMDEHGHDA
jgi:hypothetical protein